MNGLLPLQWQAENGLLVECLKIKPERAASIEREAGLMIDGGCNTIQLINHMRKYCQTDEEFTGFIFGLGFMQGRRMPFGFKIT